MISGRSHPKAQRKSRILKSAALGPFLVGFIFGGIPVSLGLMQLGSRFVSPELLRRVLYLTPLAILVTVLEVVLTTDGGKTAPTAKALITSFSACIPLPLLVCCVLLLHFGDNPFSFDNLAAFGAILLVWAAIVALISWLLGSGLLRIKRSSLL